LQEIFEVLPENLQKEESFHQTVSFKVKL
jgi:hypothetical protein